MRSSRLVRLSFLPAFCCALFFGRISHAQSSDAAAAQSLFDSGKELMKQGHYAEACAKLEKSQALDPAGGTLLHLAACREAQGKLASAWTHYNEALSTARRDRRADREEIASKKVRELGPKLAKLTIIVEAPVEGMKVLRGGVPVDSGAWGTPVPIDRGQFEIVASAPNYESASQQVSIDKDGVSVTIKVPALQRSAAAPPPEPSAVPPAPAAGAPPANVAKAADQDRPEPSSTQRTVGIVLMGVGGAALAAGAVFGGLSLGEKSTGTDHCKLGTDGNECDAAGFEARENALAYGNISTIAVIVGLVGGGAGAYLFFSSGNSGSETGQSPARSQARALGLRPVVSNEFGGVDVVGVF